MTVRSALVLTLALASTASAAPRDPVQFAGVLEQMRGHYDAMLLNVRAGNQPLALKHAGHPANELYAAMQADLNAPLRARFLADYKAIDAALKTRVPATVQAALNTFSKDVDAALATVPAATRQDPKYIARVISTILGNTKTEYGEGVRAGQIINPAEYQDAQFYLARASGWLTRAQRLFPADQGGQAAAALAQAKTLHAAKADPTAFSAQLDRARTELAEISGDPLTPTSGPMAEFDAIDTLLAQAKSHFQGGMTDAANEAVISAYLDHYEQLEAPLAVKDKPLELKLEETLKNGLRQLITRKVTPAQFTAAVDAALADLRRARGLLQ
ncbi:hypothetical protein HNQ07_004001 [Deinococcus metalli]|uniref:DUF3829 domain-containing protein n=1 Tax=Deinococcus metalli TaxID=1141878 RepID=A0A7W8KL12_9DEIO|nr:hypothetical protein [Deinococcus metalli]MBB5378494.1 hypothetical protein [Deinococcus metalli]GHF58117.1 hypothetical protein GCM10017781_37940 [Deinococcus metalli]